MRRDFLRVFGGVVAAVLLAACSSKSTAGAPSSSAAPSTVATTSAAAPKPSAPAPKPAALKCPDDFYQSEEPAYCLKIEQGRPGRAEMDGAWISAPLGPSASIGMSRTESLESAIKEIRALWGTEELKERSKYTEEVDAGRTIIRFRSFNAHDDPKALDAKDILVVLGRSGDMTLRCQVHGDVSPDTCLSLILPK